uniref:Ig-like domain-containing protein n=2 Tax=Pygocentrus nattereri TaxID=42514 RepID=A0A3B4EB43_PYGNA
MMDPAVIIILLLYRIDSTQAVRNSEPLVISAEPGEAVNLTCTFVDDSKKDVRMWYKQRLEHAPLEVGSKFEDKPAVIPGKFDKSRFKLNRIASGISLSIERVTKEDEGMYFCGETGKKTLDFSTATFLAVTGQSDISVLQTSVRGSVSPGELVTLQCTVISEIRAADLRVLWFRAAAGQSFPEIIYTHQNSSSRQCEISSSTSCSLYEFSKNILDQHHTGTYYCAVAACGKIIFGNGTSVELKDPVVPVMLTLAVFSAVCVAVICTQTILIHKLRKSEHCAERVQQGAVSEWTTRQDSDSEEFDFTALRFSEKMKRRALKEKVFTRVRFFPVSDYRAIQ